MVNREALLKEQRLKSDLQLEGVRFLPQIFAEQLDKNENLVTTHLCMDNSLDDTVNERIPTEFRLQHGSGVALKKHAKSPFVLEKQEDGIYVIDAWTKERLSKIFLPDTPAFYSNYTSDGVQMKKVLAAGSGSQYGECQLQVIYSNECSLLQSGKDCLFCNINATKRRFGEKECIQWKNPTQIAETVKAAYAEGYNEVTISGGYVPEHRELEYYLDTAEKIQELLGKEDFGGTATIGAPVELSVIEKYKEAGFQSLALNIEVFGRDFFRAICPGKVETCGEYEHWIEALQYAVDVFGKGHVRSGIVSGLQPKSQLIEGIEMLAEMGVVTTPSPWNPNIGSAYEGHRSPTPDWHWDVLTKNYQILRKNGRTYRDVYFCTGPGGAAGTLIDLFRIDDGIFPTFD